MTSKLPFVYIPDCPLREQPVFGWSFYCRPIHVFVPPGPLESARISDLEEHGFFEIHRAEGVSEKEIRRLINDWEQWARDHQAMDWNALKAFENVQSKEPRDLPNIMKEIRRFGSETISSTENRVRNQALLLHLARRLWNTDRECRDILDEVRTREDALKDLIGASDSELFSSKALDLDGAIEFDEILKRQLEAWGYFYGPMRPSAAHYVTDNEHLTRYFSTRLESMNVCRFELPLFLAYGPEQLDRSLQESGKLLLEELYSCFNELARLTTSAELSLEGTDALAGRFADASESIKSTVGKDIFPLNADKDLSVDLILVENQGLEQLLFAKSGDGRESRAGTESHGWTSIFALHL